MCTLKNDNKSFTIEFNYNCNKMMVLSWARNLLSKDYGQQWFNSKTADIFKHRKYDFSDNYCATLYEKEMHIGQPHEHFKQEANNILKIILPRVIESFGL